MKKLFRRGKKKSASETGSIASGSGSGYNVSPKKDLGKLHKAAHDGDLAKLKSVLKRSDVNLLDKDNRTPLHFACVTGKYEAVKMLTDIPQIKLNLCDNNRCSALIKCVQSDHRACLTILLEKGADVSLSDENGNTALHIAASIPNNDIVYLLGDYGADPTCQNKDGAMPLHIVAGLGSDELVIYFLDAGVDVNCKDSFGKTPLMYAAHKGHLSTVKLLLSRDCNAAIRDDKGWTADDYASMDGHHPISHVIVEHEMKHRSASTPKKSASPFASSSQHTTPQRLGVQVGTMSEEDDILKDNFLDGPALDRRGYLSPDDESQSVSKVSNDDSWADSDEEISEKAKPTQAKPKLNLLKIIRGGSKDKDIYSSVTPKSERTSNNQQHQIPSKTTTNLFLTSSARKELEKKEKQQPSPVSEEEKDDDPSERKLRDRYESNSARGLPVSPSKPPLPKPRMQNSPNNDRTASAQDSNDAWDSTDEDESDDVPSKKTINPSKEPSKSAKPNKAIMSELGFDEDELENLYSDNESKSVSEASKHHVSQIKPKDEQLDDDSDSWDDSESELQDNLKDKDSAASRNYMAKLSSLKFEDESDDKEEKKDILPQSHNTGTSKNKIEDDSSSEDEDSFPESMQNQAKEKSVNVNVRKPGLGNKMSSLGIVFTDTDDSHDEESEIESESSWERENRNNKKPVAVKNSELKESFINNLSENKQHSDTKKMQEEEVRRTEKELLKQKEYEESRKAEKLLREEQEERRKADEALMLKKEEARKKAEELLREKEREERQKAEEVLMRKKEEERRQAEERLREKEQEERLKAEEALKQEERRKADLRREQEREERRKAEETLKLKEQEQKRKSAEELKEKERELREAEELEKLNRMNAEIEKQNAELARRRQVVEEEPKDSQNSDPINQSFRNALERAADRVTDSGDSESEDFDLGIDAKANVAETKKHDIPVTEHNTRAVEHIAPHMSTKGLKNFKAPKPSPKSAKRSYGKNITEVLSDSETDTDFSFSENVPEVKHLSPLSDSIKLVEQIQIIKAQLTREKDVSGRAFNEVEKLKVEIKLLHAKERRLIEEKRKWELDHVEMESNQRELEFEVKTQHESLETAKFRFSQAEDKCVRLENQLQIETDERRKQEDLVAYLRKELKIANDNANQLETRLANERSTKSFAEKLEADSLMLNQSIRDESVKSNRKLETLEEMLNERNEELIKVKLERDRYEDSSTRYKSELNRLRSQDSDDRSDLATLNKELTEKLEDMESQLRESEEALQITALRSLQCEQAYQQCKVELEEEKKKNEKSYSDSNEVDRRLKADLEDSRVMLHGEQEKVKTLEMSEDNLKSKLSELQERLMRAETKASHLENNLELSSSSVKQRSEEAGRWENDARKLQEQLNEKEKNLLKLHRENAEQAGKVEALKVEVHQRESECVQMRQETDDLRSRSTLSVTEQQDKLNSRISALQHEHENERIAYETKNVQLTEQVEHWKLEVERMEKERLLKEEQLAQAQQDRIETHKQLGYADAFSKSTSKEHQHLMTENSTLKDENIKLQSRVSLFEEKFDEKSLLVSDLQKELSQVNQKLTNASNQIEVFSEKQKLKEIEMMRIEQHSKDLLSEKNRIISELESVKLAKEKLEKERENEAYSKTLMEGRISSLDREKLITDEKLANEVKHSRTLQTEADRHCRDWEAEVKAHSVTKSGLLQIEKENEDQRKTIDDMTAKLSRALEERKTFKTKYERMKKVKSNLDRRAESYRLAANDASRRSAELESDCESQISQLSVDHIAETGHLEITITKLKEQISSLTQRFKDRTSPSQDFTGICPERYEEEMKKVHREKDRLNEELQRFRSHVEKNYVDRSQLEAVRQEERVQAQAALAPTLDQVNSYLKDRQIAQDIVDEMKQKNEEQRYRQAVRRISSLEEELALLRRRNEDMSIRQQSQHSTEYSKLYERAVKDNEIMQQQLSRSKEQVEDLKLNLVKERRKFQTYFSNTLGGSLPNSGQEHRSFSFMNGTDITPKLSASATNRLLSSTPNENDNDPLSKFRKTLDVSIAQHLANSKEISMPSFSGERDNLTPSGSSAGGTPRSDRSSQRHLSSDDARRPMSNEYMSFLLP